jgi:alpha-tubulin suppressor-like RCC1 family protein
VPVSAKIEHARTIAAGRHHVCAVDEANVVWCWGGNSTGQLGLGDRFARNVPTKVPDINDAVDVLTGADLTCAIRAEGRVTCWGDNVAAMFDPEWSEMGAFDIGEVVPLRAEPPRPFEEREQPAYR